MDKRPELERFSELEKDALIAALWAEVQRLKTRLAALAAKAQEPCKEAHHSSVSPSQTPQANCSPGPRVETRREASGGRAGGGRPLHQEPDQVIIAQVKTCPHCGGAVQVHEQHPHAVYDTIELPPITPIVTRVEQHGGPCPHCGQLCVAPVPGGMAPGAPFGTSIETLATYLRSTHAISDAQLSALFTQVYGVSISKGALANLFQRVHIRLDDRVTEIRTRLRSSRLICSDETGARVNGRTQWAWVFQHAEVCVHVIRPNRDHGVI
jgi:transposase